MQKTGWVWFSRIYVDRSYFNWHRTVIDNWIFLNKRYLFHCFLRIKLVEKCQNKLHFFITYLNFWCINLKKCKTYSWRFRMLWFCLLSGEGGRSRPANNSHLSWNLDYFPNFFFEMCNCLPFLDPLKKYMAFSELKKSTGKTWITNKDFH